MKDFLTKILNVLMWPVGVLYSERVSAKFRLLSMAFYSSILRTRFARCGRLLARGWNVRVLGGKHMVLGDNVYVDSYVRLETVDSFLGKTYHPKLTIGDNVVINMFCHIGCINEVRIGNWVTLAERTLIVDHHHGNATPEDALKAPRQRDLSSKGPVIIEDAVAIGENCAILPGVTIGHHSMVGANSVVTHSCPPYSVVAGNPARVLKILH